MVLGVQIAGLLFGLFMMYYSFVNYKKNEFTIKELIFWFVLWILFIIIALFPFILDPLSESLNFARTFDLLIIGGFIGIILAIFYTYSISKKNQRQIESVVREIALSKAKKK